ncbi:GntP family permease [Nocardioides deserti]|uniref:GntP family permease n=1 Tax=Nocardioides deserti TaxID=1588644 RepID=A0ABR6U4Q0_9ACTN|nr:GntP family permease [Nocardioides deserti]MBC2958826.1 GntP family permease [Nocardioides deserti]GGO69546.1 gluconate transporter [Nocardioides deserti]
MDLVLVLVAVVALIVVATTVLKTHPFLALLLGAFLAAFGFRMPLGDIVATITGGFGGILGGIGIVIVLGTVIGVVLERSGAAVTMAEVVIRVLGQRFPTLTISVIGFIVSIPVFCDSGYVILNSLKESIARRTSTSMVAMSVALATGLFATHTLVPPTPGPIAAAGNLGLTDQLGLVILVGLLVAVVAAGVGLLWANRFTEAEPEGEGAEELTAAAEEFESFKERYGTLPGPVAALAPILVPILLICLGSVAALPAAPLGDGTPADLVRFFGEPVVALLVGLALALLLVRPGADGTRRESFRDAVTDGVTAAAPILLITGAGGAFGAVIQATEIGDYLGSNLSELGIGVLMPFLVAAALKSAQGSSTVALVTTSALVAPLLGDIGMDSDLGRVLVVMAIGAGAMTVSHANDSYFWVVTQFSRMSVAQAYRAQTAATLVMGLSAAAVTWVLSLVLV